MCNKSKIESDGAAWRWPVDASGASALEFAIVAPVFLALVFVIFGVGKIYFDRQSFQFAVEQAGRQIALTQNVTEAQLRGAIESRLDAIGNPDISVAYTVLTINGSDVGYLAATMNRTYDVPLVTSWSMTYTADTYMPVRQ